MQHSAKQDTNSKTLYTATCMACSLPVMMACMDWMIALAALLPEDSSWRPISSAVTINSYHRTHVMEVSSLCMSCRSGQFLRWHACQLQLKGMMDYLLDNHPVVGFQHGWPVCETFQSDMKDLNGLVLHCKPLRWWCARAVAGPLDAL